MPEVEVVRPFNKTAAGDMAEPGEVIEVEATRAEELKRGGLARDPAGPKAAPEPANKMAPKPADKVRRGAAGK